MKVAPVTLVGLTLDQLFLSTGTTPALSILSPPTLMQGYDVVSNDLVLRADVYSACYKNTEDQYVYLYQVHNTGGVDFDPVEEFRVAPFYGANPLTTQMGFIIGPDVPTGFLTGGSQNPQSLGNIKLGTRPLLSFSYSLATYSDIGLGEHSAVMYVISPWAPHITGGYIIDGAVASGEVVGTPEPATMAILAIGGGMVLLRSKRRK
jgi:hypothetical protein